MATKRNVHVLGRTVSPESVIQRASVSGVYHGEATQVFLDSINDDISVTAHASNVPSLSIGDEVLVVLTHEGVTVTHRLRKADERPQQGFNVNLDGSLQLENGQGIVLQTQQARIELRKDGRLLIDGKEIYSIADGKHCIQGTTIDLN